MATKRTVELADKTTSFHDFETGFDIVRNQRKELTEPLGRETRRALQSGRLVVVAATADKQGEK